MPRVGSGAIGLVLTALIAGACADARVESLADLPDASFEIELPDLGLWPARAPVTPLVPLTGPEGRRDGGTILLARWSGQKLALIADADAHALQLLDLDSHAHRQIDLDGEPSQLAVADDGRIWIALRDRNELVSLELLPDGAATINQRVTTPDEPVALAVSPDGEQVFVTSGWGRSLSGYAVPSATARFHITLEREPRGITVSSDGRSAHVVHAVGSVISRIPLPASDTTMEPKDWPAHETIRLAGVDFNAMSFFPRRPFSRIKHPLPSLGFLGDLGLKGDQIFIPRPGGGFTTAGSSNEVDRRAVQGFAVTALDADVFVPQVLVHRGGVMTGGYGTSESFEAHQPALVRVHDGEATIRVPGRTFAASASRQGSHGQARHDDCRLPRAAAVDAAERTLLVSCLGIDEVRAFTTADGPLATSGRGRWKVAAGPTGIAVDPETHMAWVWSQFAGAVSSIELPRFTEEDNPPLFFIGKPDAPTQSIALKRTFHDGPHLSAQAQRGRELFHAAGDRRIAFDGRACASCHPDGRDDGLTWPTPNGPRQTPMLAGRLGAVTAPYGWHGESESIDHHVKETFQRLGGQGLEGDDLAALIAYLQEMSTPKAKPVAFVDVVEKGKALFHAETVGCATCHTEGGAGSDGARHEVGSGPNLETPSLRFVAGTAPYFHDGRYETLSDMLRDTQGKMGWGSHLGADDLAALEAYLLTL